MVGSQRPPSGPAERASRLKYDTIIVGAGSAGAILATRLSEDPNRSILLLEAGPDYPEFEQIPDEIKFGSGKHINLWATIFGPESRHDWDFVARATDEAEPMAMPRGKVVGGTSAVNTMIFLRGLPEDYDAWADAGNDKWGFRELLPFFRKIEADADYRDDFHGTYGPIVARRFRQEEWNPDQRAFYEACLAIGYPDCQDHNNPDGTGVGPVPVNNRDGVRWSTAIGYLSQARHRVNLTIRPDCLVHSVVFDGQRAIGLRVESGAELFTVYGEEVVLSAGAVGSPHILMLSGIGATDRLGDMGIPVVQDIPGVGQNLRDHPQVSVTWKMNDTFRLGPAAPRIQLALRYTARASELRNDMVIFPLSFAKEGDYPRASDDDPLGISMAACIQLAGGSGDVRLTSADPHVQPSLDFNYLVDPFDRERLREAVHICVELATQDGLRGIVAERVAPTDADLRSDESLDRWLKKNVRTSHHASGTCKMGPASDPRAVVDQHGKVHGVQGLRVADASIMPNCPRANTNVTAMVIGERIGDLIRLGH